MSEEVKKLPRLGKAAKDFNVSIATIVEFLSQNGFPIEDGEQSDKKKENIKLTQEMYDLLVKTYQSDRNTKEKAAEIEIGVATKAALKAEAAQKQNKEKKKAEKKAAKVEKNVDNSVTIPETTIEQNSDLENIVEEIEKIDKEEIVVEPVLEKINIVEKPEEENFSLEIPKIQKPKILGKVDLTKIDKPTKPVKKTKLEKATKNKSEKVAERQDNKENIEESISKEIKLETASNVLTNPTIETTSESKLDVEIKPSIEENIVNENTSEKVEATTSQIKEEKPIVEESAQQIAEPVNVQQEKPEPEHIRTVIPQLQGIKTTGKIDLSAINDKTKPKKKSKEDLRKEKEERIRAEKMIAEQIRRQKEQESGIVRETKPKEDKKENNFIKTKVERLSGTKVVGKIDNVDDLKKGHTKEGGERKEKRKRITKYSPDEKMSFETKKQDFKERRKERHREKRPDINFEEVEDQIRRTMAKMGPLGKTKAAKHRREKRELIQQEMEQAQQRQALESNILKVTEFITANELATMMNVPVNKIIATCMSVGLFISINQRLEKDNIELLAEEYGFKVQFSDSELEDEVNISQDDPALLTSRAPIVTVMGHVDHGKTSLLDYIRKTNVIAGEAGGITQHIGAYEVHLPDGRKITFLDTPGHEAFTAMRARGAKITDIVIIVIAADDSVMPQTIEAINHAQAAGVPMIFAINKIDKPGAEPDKIRTALANMNLLVEEWGGKIQSQEISAKKGINVDVLLEKVLIEAEMLELKANPTGIAAGTVIESSLDKGRGYIAKMLVQNGTLKKGDIVVAGTSFGKIKAMYNERNQLVTEAGPSTPILLLGLDSAPQAGDTFRVYSEEREAKSVVSKRQQLLREQGIRAQKHITLSEIGRRIAIGDFKELNIIIKGDVDGSIEALSDSVLKLSTEDVQVNVIHKSVGQVTESDVLLASASNAIILAFQVRPSNGAKKLAEQEQIDIRTYSVIYDTINDLKEAIAGMKAPELKENIVCNIEVRETFHISKVGTIAGCYVLDGKVQRTTRIRIIRDGIVIYTGRLGSLKRFKDDVREVTAGYECGLNIESFNDVRIGDIIEGFEEVEVKKS